MPRRCLDDRTQRLSARLVPGRARLAARCRPPAIAIHDNRNMDGQLFLQGTLLHRVQLPKKAALAAPGRVDQCLDMVEVALECAATSISQPVLRLWKSTLK